MRSLPGPEPMGSVSSAPGWFLYHRPLQGLPAIMVQTVSTSPSPRALPALSFHTALSPTFPAPTPLSPPQHTQQASESALPGLMLKVLWMELRRMQVTVLMTACMCEQSCMAHSGKAGAEPFSLRLWSR